jgi:hypothetical protein
MPAPKPRTHRLSVLGSLPKATNKPASIVRESLVPEQLALSCALAKAGHVIMQGLKTNSKHLVPRLNQNTDTKRIYAVSGARIWAKMKI